MSKTLTVRLTGRVFFANESSDFRRWLKWHAMLNTFLLSSNDVFYLESRPLILMCLFTESRPLILKCLFTGPASQSIQKQIVKYDMKRRFIPWRILDRRWSRKWKTFSEEILLRVVLLRVVLIASSFLIYPPRKRMRISTYLDKKGV